MKKIREPFGPGSCSLEVRGFEPLSKNASPVAPTSFPPVLVLACTLSHRGWIGYMPAFEFSMSCPRRP